MEAERWRRVQEVFDRALELEAPRRRDFVLEESAGDGALAQEIFDMLEADQALGDDGGVDFLEKTVMAGQTLVDPSDFDAPTSAAPSTGATGASAAVKTTGESTAGVATSPSPSTPHAGETRALDPSEAATVLRVTPTGVTPGRVAKDLSDEIRDFGKYQLLEKVGEGGFGQVYRARDPMLGRDVAIKTCTSGDERLRQRFLREAKISAGLQHPNIVTIFDFGYQDDIPYLVQEFLEGEDLSILISRREAMAAERVEGLLLDAARGLAHAHDQGVLHRDVKPGNVRVLPAGQIKILDFGIARLRDHKSGITSEGVTLGTVGYLAPEQLSGGTEDERSDIFAFGVMAYELLCFDKPFSGETFSQVSYKLLFEPPKPVREQVEDCPEELAALVEKCLEKKPEDRYASFHRVIRDLERLKESSRPHPVGGVAALSEGKEKEPEREPGTEREKPSAEELEQAAAVTELLQVPAGSRRRGLFLTGAAVLAAVAIFFFWSSPGRVNIEPASQSASALAAAPAPPEVSPKTSEAVPVDGERIDAVALESDVAEQKDPVEEEAREDSPPDGSDLESVSLNAPVSNAAVSDLPNAPAEAREDRQASQSPGSDRGSLRTAAEAEDLTDQENVGVPSLDAAPEHGIRQAQIGTSSSESPFPEAGLEASNNGEMATPASAAVSKTAAASADQEAEGTGTPPAQSSGVEPSPASTPPSPADVSEITETEPELIERAEPEYPPLARRRRLEATVVVLTFVSATGTVERTLVKHSSTPGVGFEEAALEAARQCRFTPGTRGGEPTGFWKELAFEFNLR